MFEPRHLEQAKKKIAADRAADKLAGRERLADHYFDNGAVRMLAQMLASGERQQAHRDAQKARFTERGACRFYRDADDRLVA